MSAVDSWSSIETVVRQRLDLNEIDRRYCVVCGRQGHSLSRCFGCQMVYYCGEEHQAEDWTAEHAHKCAQLEWVALGEFIQALPARPPLPALGEKWTATLKEIHSWKQWFTIRPNLVTLANNTANVFQNLKHLTDKRQPTHQNAVDGLLAAVTDLLTHVLTIGKAIVALGLRPHLRPLVVHVLSGFNKIDLLGSDPSTSNLPARFHELLNMFPDNKGVELLIVIGDDDHDDTDQSSGPQAKLKPDRLIITTTGKGRSLDTSEEKRLQRSDADLLVHFNASHLFSPLNKDLLRSMLARQRPTMLTFEDEDEFNEAKMCLSSQGVRMHHAGANQFGSLIIRQRANRPNSVYSANSYQILLNATAMSATAAERNDENAPLAPRQRLHQSSTGALPRPPPQQQPHPGPKQVNGRAHIESFSSSSSLSSSSHNTQANNNGTPFDTNVRIVSSANTTTTVQPAIRPTNNTRQPTVAQRRHHSPPSAVITSTAYKETRLSTSTAMLSTMEPTRLTHKPQPKPRLSLAKTIAPRDADRIIPTTGNGGVVQRIKPFFEPPSLSLSEEPKPIRPLQQQQQQQQRPPITIPYTYQAVKVPKATCLDDIIPSKKIYITSPVPPAVPPPPPVETYIDDRVDATVRSPSTPELRPDPRPITVAAAHNPPASKLTAERRLDERTMKTATNSIASPSTIPIEIHRDQPSVMSATTIASPRLSSSSSTDNRFEGRVTTTAAPCANLPFTRVPPAEARAEQSSLRSENTSNSSTSTSSAPPPRPPPPTTLLTTNTEVIYTEVIKSHDRPTSAHQTDLIKSPLSPSRSFTIPSKSPSMLSKTPSYTVQRPSRPTATSTTSTVPYHANKSKPLPSSMTADRISLYSQRSNRQPDGGVTIKNLSECIDRVGIIFDETTRSHDAPSVGLTTVDLIREQLSTSTVTQPTGSLLDKLYKSNSSTRLSAASSSRAPSSTVGPRSKSQQAPRIQLEPPSIPKATPTTPPPTTRRPAGVFLPLTVKNTQEPEQTTPTVAPEQSSTLVYQNLELHPTSSPPPIETAPPVTRPVDYTLKQPASSLCNGIPKPFRKPTAIIEPSPVIPPTVSNPPSEPNYVNLLHREDQHIYTNEGGMTFAGNSHSNSYTSKTSSVYSSTDRQNVPTRSEPLYAVANVTVSSPHDQSVEYDSFDDDVVVDDNAKMERPLHSHDNTDDDSFDDDDQQVPPQAVPPKNPSASFFRSTLNRLTRSNKSLERLNSESTANDVTAEANPNNIIDIKTKKTLRSIKARHEAKKTGNLLLAYTGDDDTTSIDSNCSTQTATSLNKGAGKSSHHRFRLFRRKVEKDFASDTEAEKQQTEQRRKKWNKKMLTDAAQELKNKRLLLMSDDDDDESNPLGLKMNDDAHIYDHIVHDEVPNPSSRMGKLSHETHVKMPTITLDEIRSELQAEIAARQDTQTPSQSITSSNLTLQKKRSKSVTFLDELLSDNSKEKHSDELRRREPQVKPSTTAKRIEKGDARSICGALTGTGPIRGIIKAANNEITGTTAPISPSAAAAIYLSGANIEPRCTSPKAHDRTHRPLSTYTVGSARFYDGSSSTANTAPPLPPPPHPSQPFNNQLSNASNHRPPSASTAQSNTSDSSHHKRPTAKVSPFQTKSPNDASSSSSPISATKHAMTSAPSKKVVRPALARNPPMTHDISNVATSSISDGVGGVSKRLQSNF